MNIMWVSKWEQPCARCDKEMMCDIKWSETGTEWLISRVPTYLHGRAKWRSSLDSQGMDRQRRLELIKAWIMMLKGWGAIWYPGLPVSPTWGGSVPIQQVVIFSGVEVHDDAGSIKQLLVTAGAGDAVVTVPAVSSVIQLLRLHLAMHPSPGWWGGRKKKREDGGDTQTRVCYCWIKELLWSHNNSRKCIRVISTWYTTFVQGHI